MKMNFIDKFIIDTCILHAQEEEKSKQSND